MGWRVFMRFYVEAMKRRPSSVASLHESRLQRRPQTTLSHIWHPSVLDRKIEL